jgi:spermidine/putrescine transport system ATP-binding protein
MVDSVVELRQVSKIFSDEHDSEVTAVTDINLRIPSGEFFTLLGPSGCGKTTTLRLIAGFETPTTGEVFIQGKCVNQIPPNRRPVNTVFQSYALFPHMTVEQNVAYGLVIRRIPAAERKARVQQALALVRMTGMERRKPSQLSGGQQQRIALARAIVNRPAVLLLDEPLGALDLKLRKEMQIELKQLQSELGITFIYITHDQEEALTMSDRIAVMSQGRVLQIDTPLAIYEKPASRFVADFIGETNFLPAYVEQIENGQVRLRIAGEIVCMERNGVAFSLNQAIAVAVRPEKMNLAPPSENGESLSQLSLSGVVRQAIYLGTDTRYIVELNSGENIAVRVQNAGTHNLNEFIQGASVKVRCQAGDARLLTE